MRKSRNSSWLLGRVAVVLATLFAMNTNTGMWGYTFTVPEPNVGILMVGALGLLLKRRRSVSI